MENKTAVEWLNSELERLTTAAGIHMSWKMMDSLINEAKEKEKENLIDFFMFFRNNGERYLGLTIEQFVEEFYNQKYK
jgi:hypothetical protein